MRNTQTVEVTLAASTNREIQRPGRAWMIKSSSQPLDVTEKFKGSPVGKAEGVEQGMGFPGGADEKGFHSLVLNSTIAQTVQVVISDRPMIMQRLSGTVQVVDGNKEISRADRSFSFTKSVAAVSAEFGLVQLFNPAGSGKRILIYEVFLKAGSSGTPSLVVHQFHDNTARGIASGSAESHYNDGGARATSVLELRSKTDVATVTPSNPFAQIGLEGLNDMERHQYPRPIILEPGAGFTCESQHGNQAFTCGAQIVEEDN